MNGRNKSIMGEKIVVLGTGGEITVNCYSNCFLLKKMKNAC